MLVLGNQNFAGGLRFHVTAVSGNYTALVSDTILETTGTLTVTLPDATTCKGQYYRIKKTDANTTTLTIATTSSQTVDGQTTWTITAQYTCFNVYSNGSNWSIC